MIATPPAAATDKLHQVSKKNGFPVPVNVYSAPFENGDGGTDWVLVFNEASEVAE